MLEKSVRSPSGYLPRLALVPRSVPVDLELLLSSPASPPAPPRLPAVQIRRLAPPTPPLTRPRGRVHVPLPARALWLQGLPSSHPGVCVVSALHWCLHLRAMPPRPRPSLSPPDHENMPPPQAPSGVLLPACSQNSRSQCSMTVCLFQTVSGGSLAPLVVRCVAVVTHRSSMPVDSARSLLAGPP